MAAGTFLPLPAAAFASAAGAATAFGASSFFSGAAALAGSDFLRAAYVIKKQESASLLDVIFWDKTP